MRTRTVYGSARPPLDGSDIRLWYFDPAPRLRRGYAPADVHRFQAQVAALVDYLQGQLRALAEENHGLRGARTDPPPGRRPNRAPFH